MTKSFHARIADDGRVIIPAPLRKQLGLHPGDTVVLEQDGNALRISGYAHVIKEVQAAFAPYHVPGRSEVDELIAERRAEAFREEAEITALRARHGTDSDA
ncbi:AbrB/MazE/SpoVT family DNA-binding domain-containing protein [Fimbriiglobus ruber]|uniref:SpoVT-AbrB domain-containing protein n=1 Tax=Fimbriiglobus ruber TaxID=1908690 RepID=A0A225D8Q4_9BACT|nr:AbrB/MazE/SpoVT family DNA-binding domain-containing protein [Fimbriiglobus ruber]OWK34918.1 hypothetical protein FRUB_09760 [Fimbriiglobus ruber]